MPDQTIAHYQITGKLGQGGMGEVYRAIDTKLDREVAIKVLPKSFAEDATRLARFEREAKVLAALNHPNIAIIYGTEQSVEAQALIMELVEGETLGERLQREPMTVPEALDCCRQIANALETAHDKGIIHRDLKPENVKIDQEGRVKVLDFGLAKEVVDRTSAGNQGESPTITHMTTVPGELLGTAPYMSPEQARGRPVDKRSDIWSFGCVLYECLTGKPMFSGEDITETLAGIIKGEPDWGALPEATPPTIELLLRKCLNKDRKRRLHDIADARIDIEQALGDPSSSIMRLSNRALEASHRRPNAYMFLAIGVILGGLAAGMLAWRLKPDQTPRTLPVSQPVVRSMIQPLSKIADEALFNVGLAISPDGERIAYVDQGRGTERMLVVHELSTSEVKVIPGTEGAIGPFFSPDGMSLGFVDHTHRILKTVSIRGGSPTRLADAPQFEGGVWLADGSIVFAPDFDAEGRESGLWRVSATGGTAARPLTRLDPEAGELRHRWPAEMPGNKILFTSYVKQQGTERRRVEVVSMVDGSRQVIADDGVFGRYVPSGHSSGHLVFIRGGSLYAARFDPQELRIEGNPVPLPERIKYNPFADSTQMALSNTGILAYLPAAPSQRDLVWVDNRGIAESLGAPARAYTNVSLAPNGQQIAVTIDTQYEDHKNETSGIWLYDIPRKSSLTQMVFDRFSRLPQFLNDSKRLTYLRYDPNEGMNDLLCMYLDGSQEEERLARVSGHFSLGYSMKPDLSAVLGVVGLPPDDDQDIVEMDLANGDHSQRTLAGAPSFQRGPRFSPDGNWFAYSSHETGIWEVYVKPYPGPGREKKVSDGGFEPVWDPNDNKLYYRKGDEMWMVTYEGKNTFVPAPPQFLFRYHAYGFLGRQSYAVARDGRFLMIKEDLDPSRQIRLVSNWFTELERLVPTDKK